MSRMNRLTFVGLAVIVAGIIGFAIPALKTRNTEVLAGIGDLKIAASRDTSHDIPPILSASLLALGILVVGSSLYQKR